MKKIWWKENVIYQIYPRSFKDSNGDGIGDLRGIIEKLDYIKDLGVDIIWLGPSFKSPNDDNGYDISDYYDIMDEFGTMADFDELLEGLHSRGMKLLMDLVVNHSSDEHNWFEESRKSKDNPYRDYYWWKPPAADGGPPNNWISFFGGSAWEFDELTGEYYLHLFTKKQPDLNWENPKVREEVYKLMRFWLDKGIDGFRMDVIPLISKRLDFADADISNFTNLVATTYSNGPRVHEFIQEMHEEVLQHYDIMTVGEGPGITKDLGNLYVGESRKELSMIFHLDHMFMDHGDKGRFDPIPFSLLDVKRIFNEWDEATGDEGWVSIFLDNHDFARIVSRFGNDKEYRVTSAKMLSMLLLTLRGTPCIYQGSEIGMTNVKFDSIDDYRDVETLNFYKLAKENGGDMDAFMNAVYTLGRDNVRTPMQWNDSENAGFTTGQPWINLNQNYPEVNVENAIADPNSIFYFYKKLLAFRKEHSTFVYGNYKDLDPSHEKIYAYRRSDKNETFIVVLNFSSETVDFKLPEYYGELELCISNYGIIDGGDLENIKVMPWEGRIYRKK